MHTFARFAKSSPGAFVIGLVLVIISIFVVFATAKLVLVRMMGALCGTVEFVLFTAGVLFIYYAMTSARDKTKHKP